MKKTLLAALIAATALVPPVLAQDRGHRGGRDRGASSTTEQAAPQVRQNRGEWRQRQSAQPAAQAQAPAPVQQQRQWRGSNNGGQQQARGNWNRQAQPVQQAAPQQRYAPQQQYRGNRQGNAQQQQYRGNTAQRGQWNGGYRGNGQAQQQQYRGDRGQYNRGNSGWNNNRGGSAYRNNGNRGGWNNSWRNNNRYDWRGYRNSNRNAYRLPRYYAPYGWNRGYSRFGIGYTLSSLLFSSQYWINDPYSYRLPEAYGPYRWVRYYNDALLVDVETGEVVDTIYDIFW